jgi:hypothetical protein
VKTSFDKDNKIAEALIKSTKNGDYEALKKLFDFASGRIYGLSKQICANDNTAIQQSELIFASLWEKIKFGKDNSHFLPWLVNNSVTILLNSFQKQFSSVPAAGAVPTNKYLQLTERVLQLPFNERLIFSLYFTAGKPLYKISELINLPVESIINLFNSGLNILVPISEECSFLKSYLYKLASREINNEEKKLVSDYVKEHPDCEDPVKEITIMFESLSSLPVSLDPPPALRKIIDDTVDRIRENEPGIFKTGGKQKVDKAGKDKAEEGKQKKEYTPSVKRKERKKREGIPLTSFYQRHKIMVLASPFILAAFIYAIYFFTARNDVWQIETSVGSVEVDGARIPGTGTLENGSGLETFEQTKSKMSSPRGSVVYLGEKTNIKLDNNDIYFDNGSFSISKNAIDEFSIILSGVKIANGKTELDCIINGNINSWNLTADRGKVFIYSGGTRTVVPGNYKIFFRSNNLSLPVTTDPRSTLSPYIEQNINFNLDSVFARSNVIDAFTLWNLLPRVDMNTREKVFARLFNLVPFKPDIKHDDIIKLKDEALFKWYDIIRAAVTRF